MSSFLSNLTFTYLSMSCNKQQFFLWAQSSMDFFFFYLGIIHLKSMETSRRVLKQFFALLACERKCQWRCHVDKMTNLRCNIHDHKYKTDEKVLINLLLEICIINQMRKYRIQRNNCQVSKEKVEVYTIYFYKIPLRNMSQHLKLFIDN